MIQLKPDCLIFQTSDGEHVPCSAEWITLELMGEGATLVDPELVRNASAAVLHYFKFELNRSYVSVGEFAVALEKVLRGFGLTVYKDDPAANAAAPADAPKVEKAARTVLESNLRELAGESGKGFELLFFPHLREELRRKLGQSPQVVRFHGLRDCVKQLSGAARWNRRCQNLSDQIVDYLRSCWETEQGSLSCALVVV
ncbi:MAG TPA: hypothetical protein VFC44_04750 [Candidatus Saccharimonadales bacterium]|nr:hypothetical protein [Candidatus Saccharimonadales bacterium]